MRQGQIGGFEEIVLLAVLRLEDQAFGAAIRTAIEGAGRRVSIGNLYDALNRLEERGLVSSRAGDQSTARRGRPRQYYRIEAPGIDALDAAESLRRRLRQPSRSTPGVLGGPA